MLTKEQILEIRDHLEKAQNPVFFFDNDVDGLISFVLLRRFINRGKGVAIKSFPELDESYVKRIDEFNADYVFILDKPSVSNRFLEETKLRNLPVIWIDHHDVPAPSDFSNLSYYNSFKKNSIGEPISYISYKVSGKKEDSWLSVIGCISDNYLPDFYDDFAKEYPYLTRKNPDSAFEVLYETEIGKMVSMLSFALKDRTSNVMSMINFLFNVKSPFDLLKEDTRNANIFKRFNQINKSYIKIIEKAKRVARSYKKLVFFQYGGEMSLSADIANELSYRFPGKVIMVAYVKGANANISIRGSIDVRKITIKTLKEIPNSSGGGHKHATGCKMLVDDLHNFRDIFEREIKKY
ncbi:hypothetical protein J4477_03155 [Candidatus Pacearchaeota archaeon]|nr:hypothetical protein [uncultured archaeon]MBS3072804.1 hypothetical protein [Candidatus Pacearchaeota archaeon]